MKKIIHYALLIYCFVITFCNNSTIKKNNSDEQLDSINLKGIIQSEDVRLNAYNFNNSVVFVISKDSIYSINRFDKSVLKRKAIGELIQRKNSNSFFKIILQTKSNFGILFFNLDSSHIWGQTKSINFIEFNDVLEITFQKLLTIHKEVTIEEQDFLYSEFGFFIDSNSFYIGNLVGNDLIVSGGGFRSPINNFNDQFIVDVKTFDSLCYRELPTIIGDSGHLYFNNNLDDKMILNDSEMLKYFNGLSGYFVNSILFMTYSKYFDFKIKKMKEFHPILPIYKVNKEGKEISWINNNIIYFKKISN